MPTVTNANDPFSFTATGNLRPGDVVDMDDELFTVVEVGDTSADVTNLVLRDAGGKDHDMDCATHDAVWDVRGNTADGWDLFNE